ncbi:hypothetical protein DENIS_2266 [Desulfonema ishimotonii]|uniref:Uncharacterized protein n=2 Tax=Desulfonema ishimotonii TaxID=45657 RepID=A0A401FWH0_9BACT|nr:hypothetical protein DENIS_2266 [Desulfonema ishimotonii]
MLGKISSWHEFLEVEITDFEKLPRRKLKSGKRDIKERLFHEIKKFCSKNFEGMDIKQLSNLYEEIKANRGVEIPLNEFEQQFSKVKRDILRGAPSHLTVCISLWGFKLRFPEDELTNDLSEAIIIASESNNQIECLSKKMHKDLKEEEEHLKSLLRTMKFSSRSIVLGCFNLLETYLNGLAWDFMQTNDITNLSNRKKKTLEDATSVSIRDKLIKYPEIISGKKLWDQNDSDFDSFVNTVKPYRDSLVHPSPFSAPEKFGGYDKLRLLYRIDFDTAMLTVNLLVKLIKRINTHIGGPENKYPIWLSELVKILKNIKISI